MLSHNSTLERRTIILANNVLVFGMLEMIVNLLTGLSVTVIFIVFYRKLYQQQTARLCMNQQPKTLQRS